MLLSIFLAILAAGPALVFKSEIKNFVCPTRGSLIPGGAINLAQFGTQPRVSAYLSGYKILLERVLYDRYGGIHHAFYFGIIPLILIPIALFKSNDKFAWVFFITALFMALFGAGQQFVLTFLYKYFPISNMLRHSCWFAPFVSFFLICVSGFGLKVILSKGITNNFSLILITVASVAALLWTTKDKMAMIFILASCFAILFSILLLKLFKNKVKQAQFWAYLFIFLLLIIDLSSFNLNFLTYTYSDPYKIRLYHPNCHPAQNIDEPSPVEYPLTRSLYASRSAPISLNLFPLLLKEASLNSPNEDLVLFRNARLNDMLERFKVSAGHEPALGVGVPLIYFTNDAKIFQPNIKKEILIDEIFEYTADQKPFKKPRVFFQREEVDFNIPDKEKKDISFLPIKDLEIKNDPNNISLIINAPVGGFLVRLENFHNSWKAFVDGKPTKIYRANYAFQAIKLDKGQHTVVFQFKSIYPISLWIYVIVSALVWILLNCYLYSFKVNGNAN